VIEHVPESIVKEQLLIAQSLSSASVEQAVIALGNGSQISVQDTVPFALWCAATRLDSYEEAIWLTLAGQGDCDTTCAIVGGIVVMRHGLDAIPAQWQRWCEPLPGWAFTE
jgi:ADP-ribosylglycohydrolase